MAETESLLLPAGLFLLDFDCHPSHFCSQQRPVKNHFLSIFLKVQSNFSIYLHQSNRLFPLKLLVSIPFVGVLRLFKVIFSMLWIFLFPSPSLFAITFSQFLLLSQCDGSDQDFDTETKTIEGPSLQGQNSDQNFQFLSWIQANQLHMQCKIISSVLDNFLVAVSKSSIGITSM